MLGKIALGNIHRGSARLLAAAMTANLHGPQSSSAIKGQLLRASEHRAVAIYLRDGTTWVADFVDGRGVLVGVDTWFRFNCGSLANPHALRRIALESALPLSEQLVSQIEELHRLNEPLRPPTRARWMHALLALLPRHRTAMLIEWRLLTRRSRSPRS